jgi:ABC-type Fe3+ transport system substrate-binding protein
VAAKAPTTPAEIYLYTGPDRKQILEEGARKEGKILWYTSMVVNERAKPLADAFRQQYPFVTVDIVFTDTGAMVTRATEEYRAGKYDLDMVEGSLTAMLPFKDAQIIAKYTSPSFDGIPNEVRDPDGFFVADRETPLGLAVNTQSVPEADVPKSYDDLLDPKWKGKIATNENAQGIAFLGTMLKLKGEEYLRKLAAQDLTVYSLSSRALTELCFSGEAAATFPSSVGHIAVAKKAGTPVTWSSLGQAPTSLGYVALTSRAPHPHAAMLMADFLLSPEGQKTMASTGEGGTRRGNPNDYGGFEFQRAFMDFIVAQNQYDEEYRKWEQLHKSLFVKRQAR